MMHHRMIMQSVGIEFVYPWLPK